MRLLKRVPALKLRGYRLVAYTVPPHTMLFAHNKGGGRLIKALGNTLLSQALPSWKRSLRTLRMAYPSRLRCP